MRILNIILVLFLFSLTTSAAIRYVSKSGSSTPPFNSWETASDSIQKCINICVDGDTVIIGNGIYRECFYVIKELTIFGMSMDSTIVDATNLVPGPPPMEYYCSFLFRKKSKIENITLIGKGIIPGFFTISIEDCNVTVRNCAVKSGLSAINLIGYFTDDILIDRCLISETKIGILGGGMTVLFAYEVKDCIIITVNSDFGNSGRGIRNEGSLFKSQGNIIIGKELGESAIHSESNTHSDILNNFATGYEYRLFRLTQSPGEVSNFVNNVITYFKPTSLSASLCILLNTGNLWNIKNNIIMNSIGNRPAIYCEDDTLKTDYNIFWKNDINGNNRVKFGEYDLFVDPMLINDTVAVVNGNYDYHLQAYSPAIDAGDPTILDPDGTRSDIGLYGGPFGQTYQYKDLPPRRPMGIVPTLNPKERKIVVKWDRNSEADTSHYIVYKDTVANFPTDSSHIFLTKKDTIFEDNYSLGMSRLYYRIRAVDKQGNISEASDEVSFILTDAGDYKTEVKMEYHLYQNYPNPFNPVTKISYQLPEGGYVKIMVYDIKGELLEVIVNENKPIGYYEVEFNGGRYSSGIYLYRIEVIDERGIPRFIDMKKMVLVK